MIKALKDWWRGYRDEDIETLLAKLETPESQEIGLVVEVSVQEYRAWLAGEEKRLAHR